MRISVFGLGYVGCVTAVCLASDGHEVIGVDVNPAKVSQIQAGTPPVLEPELENKLQTALQKGLIRATMDTADAIQNSDVTLICVGTPSSSNGSLQLEYLEKVSVEIGKVLASKASYHVVTVRSTILPGTMRNCVIPTLEAHSGKKVGVDFGAAMNPEFLREGTAIADYRNPSTIVIGQYDERSGQAIQDMYEGIESSVFRVPIETAEMVKYAHNAFHAVKVSFANEIGAICKANGLDGQEVMKIFCQDHHLNISTAYLKPGFAFGGSCLPKDLRALTYAAKERDVEVPLLTSIMPSNSVQIQRGVQMIENTGKNKIAIIGLSFKAGTDDVRESPIVILVETLVGRGYDVRIYDQNVNPSQLIGANKAFLQRSLPHIASLMSASLDEVVKDAEVVVITNGSKQFAGIPASLRADQTLIDFVGIGKQLEVRQGEYDGIAW